MSYSRFGDSTWYTYWSASGTDCKFKWPTKKLKNEQVFEICDFPSFSFTYGKLQKVGMRGILSKISKFYSKPHTGQVFESWKGDRPMYTDTVFEAKNPSTEELTELMEYIRKWENDINLHFAFFTFIRFEWWYPIRNNIKWRIQKIFKNDRD